MRRNGHDRTASRVPPRSARAAAAVLFLFAGLLAVAGCEEDPATGDQTTISGRVVDPDRIGIYDVHIAVEFFEDLLTGVEVSPVQEGGPELLPPYPNPTRGLDGTTVTLTVSVPADTTALLEIWSDVYGPSSRIREIHRGALTAGETSFTWNHTDQSGDPLPNGLYTARLTVPASGDSVHVQERDLLLSRPLVSITRRPEYNTYSEPSGEFILENLPIGATFTLTGSDGQVLGTGVVRSRVDVVFRDPDFEYVERTLSVTIPSGGVVDMEVVLQPLFARTGPERSLP